MDDLYIKWDTGKMLIHLNYFFPTSQVKFNKLLKIINLDWRHEAELQAKLKVYFQDKISDLDDRCTKYGKEYIDNKQRVADTQILLESRKQPNGLPVSEDELKQAKEDLGNCKAATKKALSVVNKCLKEKEQFLKHLEALRPG